MLPFFIVGKNYLNYFSINHQYKSDVECSKSEWTHEKRHFVMHAEERIFSLKETDFLKKSSMNIFGCYLNVNIRVTQK